MSAIKKIHYCWFGGGPLSDQARKSIASWEKFAPGFEIIRWDEGNFDIDCSQWTRAAYNAGKYAFVSDYARFKILFEHGGVYMDVGSELVKDITSLVEELTPFSAIEELSLTATTGLIVSVGIHDDVINSVLNSYNALEFNENPSFLLSHTVNVMFSRALESRGFARENRLQSFGDWTVLPSESFDPVFGLGGYHVKKGTYSIHRSSSSWTEPKYRIKAELQRKLAPFVGRRLSQIIGRIVGELRCGGLVGGLKSLSSVAVDVVSRKVIK